MTGMILFPMLVEADSTVLDQGEKVYADKKCSLCHEIGGKGGKFGGDLDHVGAKRDGPWLKRFMRDPTVLKPDAKMKPFAGTDDELEALINYLVSLK